uniref:MARVEL domain-containing protein n=1 Tax=Panagrellus redivivus TaxID=6233 RepID=A0A7E4UU29_PANRE
MANLNTGYVSTNRGIIKIFQIIAGFVMCSLLCANWYGGRSCFGEGRLGYSSGLNFVILIINLVLFVLNLLNLAVWKLERIYSVVATILFAIASGLLIWYMISRENYHSTLVITTILLFVQTLLFLWDTKILQGEAAN